MAFRIIHIKSKLFHAHFPEERQMYILRPVSCMAIKHHFRYELSTTYSKIPISIYNVWSALKMAYIYFDTQVCVAFFFTSCALLFCYVTVDTQSCKAGAHPELSPAELSCHLIEMNYMIYLNFYKFSNVKLINVFLCVLSLYF